MNEASRSLRGWLWWSGRQRIGDALALVIVAAVQDRDEVGGRDERRHGFHRYGCGIHDILRTVQPSLLALAGGDVRIDVNLEHRIPDAEGLPPQSERLLRRVNG